MLSSALFWTPPSAPWRGVGSRSATGVESKAHHLTVQQSLRDARPGRVCFFSTWPLGRCHDCRTLQVPRTTAVPGILREGPAA